MENNLMRTARLIGFSFLIISIYFSYDGFDQRVTGGNGDYTTIAKVIGIVLAVGFSVLQFILNSRPDQLNLTLKVAGLATYVYSIWTNYLGITHTLGMPVEMAWAIAVSLDVLPEPMIAWGFGEAMKGDLLGNLWQWAWNTEPKKHSNQQSNNQSNQQNHKNRPQPKPQHQQTRPMFHQIEDVEEDDEREEPDTQSNQPKFRPQREASFSGSRKPNGGFQDRRVRDDIKGKIGKR